MKREDFRAREWLEGIEFVSSQPNLSGRRSGGIRAATDRRRVSSASFRKNICENAAFRRGRPSLRDCWARLLTV
jgi:hypothetical protein